MTDPSHTEQTFGVLARLRSRKVVQWGLAYAAGAWGLMQGVAYMRDTFGWPRQLQQAVTILLLVGLPVVVVLAWYHGDRGEQRVTRFELVILTLLLVTAGGLVWRVQPMRTPSAPTAATSAPGPATTAEARPTIAVLPFENRSRLEDDVFFVDGIHDDILTQLSRVRALKVISRTSVERFRDTKLPLHAIAEQLGVTNILEGGVQRAGDRVRITVQLIDAASDAHIWAQNYDRRLTSADVFAVQSEIASAIANALKTALTEEERARLDAVPTGNLSAWEEYQLGRRRMANRNRSGLAEARVSFERAIHLDPKFARAYAGLADALILSTRFAGAPEVETLAKAERAVQQALALDPNLAEAYGSAGLIANRREQLDRAEAMFRRAIELDPNYAQAHQWLGGVLSDQGRAQEGLAELDAALALDPLSPMINLNLGQLLADLSRVDEAAARYRRLIEIEPSMPLAYSGLASVTAYGQGHLAEAVALQEKVLSLDPQDPRAACWLAVLQTDIGDDSEAAHVLESARKHRPDHVCQHVVSAYQAVAAGEQSRGVEIARKVLVIDRRNEDALRILRDADLAAGRPEAARSRYAAAYPELFASAGTRIGLEQLNVALDVVPVLQRVGAREQANSVLDACEALGREMPGPGVGERRLDGVKIAALRGDKWRALAGLRDAVKIGWRGPIWRYYRDSDPDLDSIRNEPEFRAAFAEIERDVARQRTMLGALAHEDAKRPAGIG